MCTTSSLKIVLDGTVTCMCLSGSGSWRSLGGGGGVGVGALVGVSGFCGCLVFVGVWVLWVLGSLLIHFFTIFEIVGVQTAPPRLGLYNNILY